MIRVRLVPLLVMITVLLAGCSSGADMPISPVPSRTVVPTASLPVSPSATPAVTPTAVPTASLPVSPSATPAVTAKVTGQVVGAPGNDTTYPRYSVESRQAGQAMGNS